MKLEPIGNLVGHVSQCDPEGLGRDWITYLDISSVDRESKQIIAPARIAAATAPSRARQQVFADDILVSTVRPNLNAVALMSRQFHGDIASTGFCVLRPSKDRVCPPYLFYFTQTDRFVSHLMRISTGASYPAVTDNDVLETQIPLPELSEQQRIAGLLEQADRLRRTRRYALELSDTFLPAAFLELFGDPVRNEKNWETKTLDEVASKITDGEHLNPSFVKAGVPIVMAEQVEDFGVNLRSCKMVSPDDFAKFSKKCAPRLGDILVVSRGATIGRNCVVNIDAPFCLMGSVILIKPNLDLVSPQFFAVQLKSLSFKMALQKTSGSSAQQAIYISQLKENKVVVPPLPIQEKFAALVVRHEHLRATQREALRQAEHLFQSLLHRAFNQES